MENYAHLLLDSSSNWDHNISFSVLDTTISECPEEWQTPDQGFAMTSIINEDNIDSNDVVDFDAPAPALPPLTHSLIMKLMSAVKIVAIMKKNQNLKLHADNKLVLPNYVNCAF